MMIYIDQETGKRVNIYAPYKGRSKLNTPEIRAAVGVIEIEDDPKPADFSYDDYTVREDWETTTRPYTIYELKSLEERQEIQLAKFVQAMEGHYDAVARVKQYDNRLTCALRAGYPGPFQTEGEAFAAWMDNCNAYGYVEMEKMKAGLRPMPTVAELIAELPAAPWVLPVESVSGRD